MNLRISYFSNFQFNWVSLKFILKVSLFNNNNNKLLNFQKPGPIDIFFILLYEIKTGEWSLKKAGNTSVFKISSCKALGMKMQSRRFCMKPKQCCCLKVNLFILGFLILQIPHKLKDCIISINFATDFFERRDCFHNTLNLYLKNTLQSPGSKRFEFLFISIVFIKVKSVLKLQLSHFLQVFYIYGYI